MLALGIEPESAWKVLTLHFMIYWYTPMVWKRNNKNWNSCIASSIGGGWPFGNNEYDPTHTHLNI